MTLGITTLNLMDLNAALSIRALGKATQSKVSLNATPGINVTQDKCHSAQRHFIERHFT